MTMNNQAQLPQVYIVHNPVAGTSDPENVRSILGDKLEQRGWKFRIHETTGQENVGDLVKNALREGFNTVWAAGGDGTVSGVANGLVNSRVPLGIIPIGSGNALARELGIPIDINAASELLLNDHRTRQLDVLQVGDDYFVLSVSVGISSLTMVKTARSQKRRFGRLAYILNGMQILLSSSFWPFQVLLDGQPTQIRASELIVANAGIIGVRPIRWGSQVVPDDGKVDLCYARVGSLTGIIALVDGILFNRQEQVEEVACKVARNIIEIRSRQRLPVQGDGEPIGYTPVKISVIPGSLSVIVPVPEGKSTT